MTTNARLLPRQDSRTPAPGINATSLRFVTGGRTPDGLGAGQVFFWSSTRFHQDFGFSMHPHEGFDIVTVVLEGATAHTDSISGRDASLSSGDVQIIRSGSGMWHAERAHTGARVFQIWLDPGFDRSLNTAPAYVDHPASQFVTRDVGPGTVTDIIGDGGPVASDVPAFVFKRIAVHPGETMTFGVGAGWLALVAVVGGAGTVSGVAVVDDSAVALREAPEAVITADSGEAPLVAYVAMTPLEPCYRLARGV